MRHDGYKMFSNWSNCCGSETCPKHRIYIFQVLYALMTRCLSKMPLWCQHADIPFADRVQCARWTSTSSSSNPRWKNMFFDLPAFITQTGMSYVLRAAPCPLQLLDHWLFYMFVCACTRNYMQACPTCVGTPCPLCPMKKHLAGAFAG